jgi:hypothetical protein
MKPKNTISIGKVNWFGGTNRNTGRINNFGFISSYLAEDFYVHKDDIVNGNLLENQFVIFEEHKQNNDKKSAKNVQILSPQGEEVPKQLLQLLSLNTVTTNIVAVASYKQHLVDWLNGSHGNIILSQLQKSKKLKATHLELINLSKNTDKLFNFYVEKYSINDLYESKISMEHIPRSYLIANIKPIIEWWKAINDAKRKEDLLEKSLSFIIRKSTYLTELTSTLSSEEIIELIGQIKDEFPLNTKVIQVIQEIDDQNIILNEYLKTSTFNDLYESEISLEHIPSSYLIANIKPIIGWWKAINDAKRKEDLLEKSLSFIIRKSTYLTELTSTHSSEEIIELIGQIKEEFPLNSKVVHVIKKVDKQNIILNEYLKAATLNDLIDSKIQMALLPDKFLISKIESAIEKLKLAEDTNKLQVNKKFLELIISKPCYIESLLFGRKDVVAFALLEQLNAEAPFNGDILSCIKDSKPLFVKYNGSYCLNDYIREKVSINLLPDWYVSEQVNKLFADLKEEHFFKEKDVSQDLLASLLKNPTYRTMVIKKCKYIHPTNAYQLIQLLSYQDKLIENKILEGVIKHEHKLSDVSYLLQLLSVKNSAFYEEIVPKNIGLIADGIRLLSDVERSETVNYLDTNCLLALIFKGVLTTNDISDRVAEIDTFIFKILRKQQTNVAPYVREVYKCCFANYGEFRQNPVIKPILLSNETILKIEQIRWKIYNKDLTFVKDVESNPVIASDPEFWILAKLLPLINPNNSYETIKKVILHELWQALLSGQVKVDHPSVFKLFPKCQTLLSHFPHMGLSCEAFIWQPKVTEETPAPEAKYLCRSRVCGDPQVVPNLNKSYLNYSAFDWLAHYGVMYSGCGPARNDFPIKLAGYFNRIRELNERLNCRSCQKLMTPNMNYARVEAVTIDPQTGNKITTPVSAAYRLTVFHCNDPSCNQNGIGHYINHCLGFKCYEIIDSRDLEEKCSEGRYICQNPECRSCCPSHTSQPQHGISDNITDKHKELYKSSPYFRSV